MELRDTQDRMQDTKNRLKMAWRNLDLLETQVPLRVFQTWFERATSPPTSSRGPRPTRDWTAISWRSNKSQHRNSISSPDSQLHANYVEFLGLISTIYVHQSTLSRYETNYALLEEEMKDVDTLLAPLHSIPPEIFKKIFLYVVAGSEMERRKGSVERGHHPPAKPWPAPFALAAVCRAWRLFVCGEPELWKYLVLDVRAKNEYCSTPFQMIHERIRQHIIYSHDVPLDITIIAWGDRLRESIVPVVLPLLQQGNLARKLDTCAKGLGRVELVTGGMNDREAGYREILAGLPPAQHLTLVRVWPVNTEIRIPASFCTQLRRIEAHDGVFRLEEPCPFVTEATLFKMDRARIRTFLDQTPNLKCLTIDRLKHPESYNYSPLPIQTMTELHTLALRITDLNKYLACSKSPPIIQLPVLRKLILIDMPDMMSSDDWSRFIDTNGKKVDKVEVRAIVAQAGRHGQPPALLSHLSELPALTSLDLVGDCSPQILEAMALQPVSRGTQGAPGFSRVTRVDVSDCTLPRRLFQMFGWSSLDPPTLVWRRGNAEDIQTTLEKVHVEDIYVQEWNVTD